MEWISVKDELPELDVDVLVFAINKGLAFKKNEKYFAIDRLCIFSSATRPSSPYFRTNYFNFGVVTHWMPLPLLPEEPK